MASIKATIVGAKNQDVPAIARKVEPIPDVLSWYISWFPKMYDLSGERLFEDSHWDVPEIWSSSYQDERMRVLVLEADERLQGYVVFQIKDYIGIDENRCLYVAFLATAPWNRKRKGGSREYKSVGSVLLAIALLFELKHIGALTLELHSLPQSEIFYRKIGMSETGQRSQEGLKLMRMEKVDALTLLRPFRSSLMRGEVKL